jgi:hypothetical protein
MDKHIKRLYQLFQHHVIQVLCGQYQIIQNIPLFIQFLTRRLNTIASPPCQPPLYVEDINSDDIMESTDDDDDMLNGKLDMEEGEIISNNTRKVPAHHERALRNADKRKLEAELLLYHHRLGQVSFSK